MSVQLTIRQKVIRILSSAVVGGLSVSLLVGETVNTKARLLSRWETDPHIAPSDFRPLEPVRAAARMIQAEEWRQQIVAQNGGWPEATPTMVATTSPALPPVASDVVKTTGAAPALEPVDIHVKIEKSEPLPTRTIAEASAPAPAASSVTVAANAIAPAISSPAPTPAPASAAPSSPVDAVSVEEVQGLFASMQEASTRLSAFPKKPLARQVASATIQLSQATKFEAPEAPTVAAKPTETVAMITGDDEPAPRGELLTSANVEHAGTWHLPGRVQAPENLPKGHFEIGLYSKIDQDGIPIGFPLVQQILPAGTSKFDLHVPNSLAQGFLYGEFVETKGGKRTWIAPPLNPWTKNERQVAELIYQQEDAVTTVAAANLSAAHAEESFRITGSVSTLFQKPGSPIPQEEVLVKVRGRKESTRTNKDGSFTLDLPKTKGTVYLEFLKPGYHPAVIAVDTAVERPDVKLELASREAVEQVGRMLGIRQITTKGVFIGRATNAEGHGMSGLSVQASVKAEGPFYFGDDGLPTADRRTTSSDGRFLFLNLDSGPGYLESTFKGEPVAPLQFSTVEGGELVTKQLTPVSGSIRGRIFNPVASDGKLQPLAGARVRIEGAADYAVSDSYGAFTISGIRWMKGERIFLELSAEKYNNHRYTISPDKKLPLNLYAFPAVYISRLAHSMDVDLDPYAGLVMGKVNGAPVRVDALADHSPVNAAKDFYFDAKGKLRESHTMTDPAFGTYVIFNVPKGRTILQGNDAQGTLRYSEAVVSSPSSVSVIME